MPSWSSKPPAYRDIVAAYYPETKPKAELRLRPCIVTAVFQDEDTHEYICEVAYGTTQQRRSGFPGFDLIVHNSSDLDAMGLPRATRFYLGERALLVWGPRDFGCWGGYKSPKISTLLEDYHREFDFYMMKFSIENGE